MLRASEERMPAFFARGEGARLHSLLVDLRGNLIHRDEPEREREKWGDSYVYSIAMRSLPTRLIAFGKIMRDK